MPRSVLVTVELLVLRTVPEPWLAFGSSGSSGLRLGGDAPRFCFPYSHPFLVDFSSSVFFSRSFVTSDHLTKCLLSPGLHPTASAHLDLEFAVGLADCGLSSSSLFSSSSV